MFKRVLIILIAGIFIFGMNKLSFAMMCGDKIQLVQAEHQHPETESTVKEGPVNVGNKICPVSGEKIKEGETYQVEYEGKIYNLCCKACMKDFKKDPQKYIKKVEEELEAGSKEETEGMKMMQEPTSSQGMYEGHHHGGDEGQHHQ